MNNLANTLGEQGQPDEAAKMRKEVLEKRRRILGEEHPSTISAMNNLANTLGEQGQLDEAAKMLQEVLEKRRRILGEEHPDTISAMNNLASTLGEQGQLDEAMALLEVAVQRMKRIHGNEHPHTRIASSTLARLSAYAASAQEPEGRSTSKKGSSLSTLDESGHSSRMINAFDTGDTQNIPGSSGLKKTLAGIIILLLVLGPTAHHILTALITPLPHPDYYKVCIPGSDFWRTQT
jgi:hypothetical protein